MNFQWDFSCRKRQASRKGKAEDEKNSKRLHREKFRRWGSKKLGNFIQFVFGKFNLSESSCRSSWERKISTTWWEEELSFRQKFHVVKCAQLSTAVLWAIFYHHDLHDDVERRKVGVNWCFFMKWYWWIDTCGSVSWNASTPAGR